MDRIYFDIAKLSKTGESINDFTLLILLMCINSHFTKHTKKYCDQTKFCLSMTTEVYPGYSMRDHFALALENYAFPKY